MLVSAIVPPPTHMSDGRDGVGVGDGDGDGGGGGVGVGSTKPAAMTPTMVGAEIMRGLR